MFRVCSGAVSLATSPPSVQLCTGWRWSSWNGRRTLLGSPSATALRCREGRWAARYGDIERLSAADSTSGALTVGALLGLIQALRITSGLKVGRPQRTR